MSFFLRPLLIFVYVLWLPIMLASRWLGYDPLQLKKPAGSTSYWLVRKSRSSRESYFSEDSGNEGRLTYREGAQAGPQIGARRSPLLASLLRAISGSFQASHRPQNPEAGEM